MADFYPLEPRIRWSDLSAVGVANWDRIDELAGRWLGRQCIALPSVRVGLCWALEHYGLSRHRDRVFVPRFIGRCILNSISRYAFPVEEATRDTRIAIVVDQFGLRQNVAKLSQEFESRGWRYLEDSPYGIGDDEAPGPGSLGRFIGLGKALPIAQGALLVTDHGPFAQFIRTKRAEQSGWSWLVWALMVSLRIRQRAGCNSTVAELAYELYPAARGGNRWLRGNLARVLRLAASLEEESRSRLQAIVEALGNAVILPDQRRVGYVVPYFTGSNLTVAQEVFRKLGFDGSTFHVDVNQNMLEPEYKPCLLLPVNPRIPRPTFDTLLDGLRSAACHPSRLKER